MGSSMQIFFRLFSPVVYTFCKRRDSEECLFQPPTRSRRVPDGGEKRIIQITVMGTTAVTKTVKTRVVELQDASIATYQNEQFTVLQVTGSFSQKLLSEFEKSTMHCIGSFGLNLAALKGIQPSLIPMLEKIRRFKEKRGHKLVLLDPPAKLLDILKLQGIAENYCDPEIERKACSVIEKNDAKTDILQETNIKKFHMEIHNSQDIERGLENAENRISSFMPQSLPIFPNWSFSAYWRACERIGGDFYDFIPISDELLGIALGDVSGHGLSAAVIMGIAKKVLRLRATDMPAASPAEVLVKVNSDLLHDFNRGSFVTILYGVLNIKTDEFVFARAGHEPPIYFQNHELYPETLTSEGMAVGLVPTAVFRNKTENCTITFEPDEWLLMFSDGLYDAVNENEIRFGRERLLEELKDAPSDNLANRVVKTVQDFSGQAKQPDDMTVISIGRTVSRPPA